MYCPISLRRTWPMTRTKRIRIPWGAFLRELDDIATAAVDFHCIVGFVVNMKDGFSFLDATIEEARAVRRRYPNRFGSRVQRQDYRPGA
jgi:hypothetical protein